MKPRYCIQIVQHAPYNGRFERGNWRAYRTFSVWPLTFRTAKAAEQYMEHYFSFKNLNDGKMSASVRQCSTVKAISG